MAPTPGHTSDPASAAMAARASFNLVGPFHALQRQLGLICDTDLAVRRRTLTWAGVAKLGVYAGASLASVEFAALAAL